MAFPLSTNQLIAHLRTSFVAINDEHGISRRIVKPYGDHEDVTQNMVNANSFLLESPPITFDIARHISKSYQRLDNYHNRRRTIKRKPVSKHKKKKKGTGLISNKEHDSKNSSKKLKEIKRIDNKKSLDLEVVDEDGSTYKTTDGETIEPIHPDNNTEPEQKLRSSGLSYTKTITGKKKKSMTPSLTTLFRGTRKKTDDRNLELIEEENNMGSDDSYDDGNLNVKYDDFDEDDDEVTAKLSEEIENNEDDALSIDSDFGVPVNSKGQVVRRVNISSKSEVGPSHLKRVPSNEMISSPTEPNTTIDTLEYDGQEYSEEDNDDNDEEDDADEEYFRDGIDADANYDEDDDEDDDDDEYDDDDDDEIDTSSTDSAFTDIEADSMLDNSILLDSFDNSFTFENLNGFHPKSKKKRTSSSNGGSYRKSLTSNALQLPSNTFNPHINPLNASEQPSSDNINNHSVRRISLPLIKKNPMHSTLHFDRIQPPVKIEQNSPHNSNLTSLIQSKYKSININPLTYFSFANSQIPNDTIDKNYTKKIHLNIFLPPKRTPTILSMEINNNSSVVDCIGYILLQLHQNKGDEEFIKKHPSSNDMNPNHWRIEMVDEDGENYGSFGILDRARLLSSYNNITDIALCKVDDTKEIARNITQTPLSPEFLLSLQKQEGIDLMIKKRKSSEIPLKFSEEGGMEIKIFDPKRKNNSASNLGGEKSSTIMAISPKATVGQVLRDYCSQQGLDSNKYKFREIKRYQSLLLQSASNAKFLTEEETIENLESKMVEIVPFESGLAPDTFGNEFAITAPAEDCLEGITPSENTYNFNYIDKDKKQATLEKKTSIDSTKSTQLTRKDSTTRITKKIANLKVAEKAKSVSPGKYLDNSRLLQSNSQLFLPTNLNSIYFKWKVWRKKTTILNKIEKSLVIDGDYIHLTPSDDAIFKKNPSGSPGIANNTAVTGTHHHFHHYNYSSYYNNLMMKTTSFHITQIVKLKQYKMSKNPNHFKIVTKKFVENGKVPNKRYDLEAIDVEECDQIIQKIKWVQQVYKNNMNL